MGFPREPNHTGHRDVRMGDLVAEPEPRLVPRAILLQTVKHASDLRPASPDPAFRFLAAQHPLVKKAHRLVAEAGGKRADVQHLAPDVTAIGDQRPRRPGDFIEIIQNRSAFDQHFAVVEHQRRHAHQRIVDREFLGVAEGRPRRVLERNAVKPQRERDPPHEWGIVLTDQVHRVISVARASAT